MPERHTDPAEAQGHTEGRGRVNTGNGTPGLPATHAETPAQGRRRHLERHGDTQTHSESRGPRRPPPGAGLPAPGTPRPAGPGAARAALTGFGRSGRRFVVRAAHKGAGRQAPRHELPRPPPAAPRAPMAGPVPPARAAAAAAEPMAAPRAPPARSRVGRECSLPPPPPPPPPARAWASRRARRRGTAPSCPAPPPSGPGSPRLKSPLNPLWPGPQPPPPPPCAGRTPGPKRGKRVPLSRTAPWQEGFKPSGYPCRGHTKGKGAWRDSSSKLYRWGN
nr:formin-like protein 14 [Loxodonta africana]